MSDGTFSDVMAPTKCVFVFNTNNLSLSVSLSLSRCRTRYSMSIILATLSEFFGTEDKIKGMNLESNEQTRKNENSCNIEICGTRLIRSHQ